MFLPSIEYNVEVFDMMLIRITVYQDVIKLDNDKFVYMVVKDHIH